MLTDCPAQKRSEMGMEIVPRTRVEGLKVKSISQKETLTNNRRSRTGPRGTTLSMGLEKEKAATKTLAEGGSSIRGRSTGSMKMAREFQE